MASRVEPAIQNTEQEFKKRAEEYHAAYTEYLRHLDFLKDQKEVLRKAENQMSHIKNRLVQLAPGVAAFINPFLEIDKPEEMPVESDS